MLATPGRGKSSVCVLRSIQGLVATWVWHTVRSLCGKYDDQLPVSAKVVELSLTGARENTRDGKYAAGAVHRALRNPYGTVYRTMPSGVRILCLFPDVAQWTSLRPQRLSLRSTMTFNYIIYRALSYTIHDTSEQFCQLGFKSFIPC